jgi:archaellum biogenesis ATPase FlaH
MNLIDKLSIISPKDAKRLRNYCNPNLYKYREYIQKIKACNVSINSERVTMRKLLYEISATTRSETIRKHVESITDCLNTTERENNEQFIVIVDLDAFIYDCLTNLKATLEIDYESTR